MPSTVREYDALPRARTAAAGGEGPNRGALGSPEDRREVQPQSRGLPAAAADELGYGRIMHLFYLERKVASYGCFALTRPIKYSWNPNAKGKNKPL